MRRFLDNSGLLICGTLLALCWANFDQESYSQIAESLRFVVNDIGMAFFFALAAKEVVEATAPGGALHSMRRSSLPLLAAFGGMAGPALVYLGLVRVFDAHEFARGWAIPSATDIAFSYLAARLIFGSRHPAIPFLLLLAIADDALGLLIIAVFYPSGPVRLLEFSAVLAIAVGMAWWLRRRPALSFWPYLLGPGVVSWFAFHHGGLHPALALVPIMPFLPHAARDAGLFVESLRDHDALNEFEHRMKLPVQFMLFFFGLVNAGVGLSSIGAGSWIVLGAIIGGKPLGILAAAGLGSSLGLRTPVGVTWRDIAVLGSIAGIGFTVALFFATASFPPGPLLDQAKMGALLSFSSAGIAALLAATLRVTRVE
ncbi:MAG: Na+/H+ antiporter NhaA [Vicinamibacterales bacterium]|nr:Na+/H+ antiporter NhaA [Vicinamibacterales bacterium]